MPRSQKSRLHVEPDYSCRSLRAAFSKIGPPRTPLRCDPRAPSTREARLSTPQRHAHAPAATLPTPTPRPPEGPTQRHHPPPQPHGRAKPSTATLRPDLEAPSPSGSLGCCIGRGRGRAAVSLLPRALAARPQPLQIHAQLALYAVTVTDPRASCLTSSSSPDFRYGARPNLAIMLVGLPLS